MPTIVWLLAAAGVWLAAVCAICVLMTVAKRADACLQPLLADPAAGSYPSSMHAVSWRPPLVRATGVGAHEPPPVARPITTPAREHLDPALWPPLTGSDVDADWSPHAYWLYVREQPVARLHWLSGRGGAGGWYVRRRSGGWHLLAVERDLDAGCGVPAGHPECHETADLAATLTTALALDAAAKLLNGPLTPPSRPLHAGRYEIHFRGLPAHIVPIAFPDAIIVRAGDVSMLEGRLDDRGLTVITRRIALLGGQILAIFHADSSHLERRRS